MRTLTELEERPLRSRDGLAALDGGIVVLGAGGKLGPSLVRLALRGVAA